MKVVNVAGKDEERRAELVGFAETTKARVTTLWHEDVTAINEIGILSGKKQNIEPVFREIALQNGALCAELKNNSVNVFVIE